VPAPVRAWAGDRLGSPVVDARDEQGGFSPGAATRLRCADGRRAFVKAVGAELNDRSPQMHRREAEICRALPHSPRIPAFVDAYDDGTWVALLFDEVDGALPDLPWRDDDLQSVLDALTELHDALTPSPIADAGAVADRLRDELNGWRDLAGGVVDAGALDDWSRRHLERLAALEARWEDAAAGTTLLHGDVRVDNVLLGRSGPVFVDWALAVVGAPMFDVVAWAPSVAMQGGPDPEDLLARHHESAAADPDAVDALVAAIAGYFTRQVFMPPPPGLPTIRAFQAAQGEVTRAWLARRLAARRARW
jgi:aminoglycoside phosphotransferase (APT) family kinase protein